jgi:acetylglutamate kinase
MVRNPSRELVPGDERSPLVLKIGGRALEAEGAPAELAADIAAHHGGLVLVHGGGNEVSDWCARLSLVPRFIDGLRVTDHETLDVAVAVLAGLANKRLVALLREAGVDAVGLSAADGGIVETELHPDHARLGRVGTVSAVRPALLETLLAQGRTPVLSSIGSLGTELLNLNADELAAALAGALRASTLVLLSDAPGVVIGERIVARLASSEVERMLRNPEVKDGMVAKLKAARGALESGVQRVRIAAWSGPGTLRDLIEESDRGTTLLAGQHEGDPAWAHATEEREHG